MMRMMFGRFSAWIACSVIVVRSRKREVMKRMVRIELISGALWSIVFWEARFWSIEELAFFFFGGNSTGFVLAEPAVSVVCDEFVGEVSDWFGDEPND